MIVAAFEGLALGASLIIAIGAQNAYVIRQGVRGEYVFPVAMVCAIVDIILISIGAAGVGTFIAQSPTLQSFAAWGGAAFLIVFGLLATRAFFNPKAGAWEEADREASASERKGKTLGAAMAAAAAFSLLNPHVYLDTVVVLGGIAAQYEADARVYFAGGAMAASLIWFLGIGYGATLVAPFFRTPTGARVLEGCVAAIMFTIAGSLIVGQVQG